MHYESKTLPEVLKEVSLQLINAADELNRLNKLRHLLIGALDIIQENTDQAEFMLELYDEHMSDYLAELLGNIGQARKLLGHPVGETELVVNCSDRSSSTTDMEAASRGDMAESNGI